MLKFGLWLAICTFATASLWVSTVPTSPQPYAVRHYALYGPSRGQRVFRFPVTGPSSDYAFTIVSVASPTSRSVGVIPHLHQRHYENFFCLKGKFQLWTAEADTFNNEEARELTPGDYGAVPLNITHTFQLLDPDTDMVVVIQPGGSENQFQAISSGNFTPPTYSPYNIDADVTESFINASAIASAAAILDVYPQIKYEPSRQLVNGSYSSSNTSTGWHDGLTANELGANERTPYFMGKDMGPKYLSRAADFYQIVQPVLTPTQSAGNLSMSTFIVAQKLDGQNAVAIAGNSSTSTTAASGNFSEPLTGHCAFQIIEGLLNFEMVGETIQMVTGDVVFVPAGTGFEYYSVVPFTKFLYISQGASGLDTRLIEGGQSGWEYPVWPEQ